MTHTLSEVDHESGGSYISVFATLDITSLDNAASENFDPETELGMRNVEGVSVIGVENPNTYVVQPAEDYDLAVEQFGGTDPTAGTDVGTVTVRVDGNRGP